MFRGFTDWLRLGPLVVGLCVPVLAAGAAVPGPEQLLPDDTLLVLTTPDFPKLCQISQRSPKGQLWNDPVMKPLRDKFVSRWQEEVVKPLERELNSSLDTYSSLLQGQLTFAVTRNMSQGGESQPLGYLLLLDTRDKAGLLKTNLANFRKQWVAAGKTIKTESIRNLEFSVLAVTTNDVPKTLAKWLWRAPVFPPVITYPELKQGPVNPARKEDMLFDMLVVLLTASPDLVFGQVDSLLVAGNSVKSVERVVTRLTGGSAPILGDLAVYQASHQAHFRTAPFYGWVNVKAFADSLSRKPSEPVPTEPPDPLEPLKPDKVLSASGLADCRTLAFSFQDSNEGCLLHFFLAVPDSARRGLLQVLAGAAKDASPPPFVPADAAQFLRWRLDIPKVWATLEKMLNDLSPQAVSAINLILDTANARAKQDEPSFDLKQTLLASLGDDIISYERAARAGTPAAPQTAPSLLLLGSPNPDLLAIALKRLFVIFPQGDTLAEREFLGRKVFSVPAPPLPFSTAGVPRPTRTLNWAASAGYVAMSTDTALLEEHLRSGQSQVKALRDKPGLLEAAQNVSGMGTGLFRYENQADTMRAAFEAAKNDPGASTNGIGPSLFPALPGTTGPESNLGIWMDFSLLPTFDSVTRYFHSSLYAASANVDGLTLKVFNPIPPSLRSSSVPKPGN